MRGRGHQQKLDVDEGSATSLGMVAGKLDGCGDVAPAALRSYNHLQPVEKCFETKQIPSRKDGYTLDLGSIRLLHQDRNREKNYTRNGIEPSCISLLAGGPGGRAAVAALWKRYLRGQRRRFFEHLWHNLSRHLSLKGVRADSGLQLHYRPCGLRGRSYEL